MGKNFKLKWKKERAGRRENGIGEQSGKIWDLKHNNREDLEIKFRKATTTISTTDRQRLIKVERKYGYFKNV